MLCPNCDSTVKIDNAFKPSPFWSWNDLLEPDELRRQVREMHKAGLGGFFMHARGGLKTKYLSPQWMECVCACLDEAEKLGMQGWLYDENGWPSGFGGGIVNGLGVPYQQKYLVGKFIDAADANATENTIAFYSEDGLERFTNGIPTEYRGKVLHCFYEVNPYYVDNLDPKVVAKFIEVTHKLYYDALPEKLLKHMRGIFTDEPQLSRRGLLWSFIIEEEYRKAYQRELLDELPKLFIDTADAAEVRVRFWSLVARLFAENFQKQIYDWCSAHNWELTGHHVLEETYSSQNASNGAIMPQYRYYHVPGMDHLCRNEPNVIAMMQVASVAAQCDKQQILTESFALTGWNFNFYGMKWMYQVQMAHGINYLCQHLQSYTLRGMRKRDYPGCWFYQMPWWNDYALINERFSRTGMLLASGEVSADVLVMHGQSTGWTLYNGNDDDRFMNLYCDSLRLLSENLDGYRIVYHYGDEQLIADLGAYENGKIRIGKMLYSQVMLPQLSNLSRQAFELFKKFKAAGGEIIAVRNQIEPGRLMIDGVAATPEERAWFATLKWLDNEATAARVMAKKVKRVVVTEAGEEAMQIIGLRRNFTNLDGRVGTLYYLVNRRYNLPCSAKIVLPEGRSVEVINADTGAWESISFTRNSAGGIELDYEFAPADSVILFVTTAEKAKAAVPTAEKCPAEIMPRKALDTADWHVAVEENYLTLDRCEFRVDGGAWEANDVSVIQNRLLKLERPCKLEMKFHFACDESFDFNSPLKLIVEDPQNFTFSFNGQPFEAVDCGYRFDQVFRVIELPKPQAGRNTLHLTMQYAQKQAVYEALRRAAKFETEYNMLVYDMEVEAVYLAGNFGVKPHGVHTLVTRKSHFDNNLSCGTGMFTWAERYYGDFVLTAMPPKIDIADLVAEGFPFFAGTIRLRKSIQLSPQEAKEVKFFRFDLDGANSLKLMVNGKEAGTAFWPPFGIPVASMFHAGENVIEIELTQSLRNLLGPFHLAEGESGGVHTLSFSKEANAIGWGSPAYDEGYCFVQVGVKTPALI